MTVTLNRILKWATVAILSASFAACGDDVEWPADRKNAVTQGQATGNSGYTEEK